MFSRRKPQTNSKYECSNDKNNQGEAYLPSFLFRSFEFGELGHRLRLRLEHSTDFDIRISNLSSAGRNADFAPK
jgi:hypothetical protein